MKAKANPAAKRSGVRSGSFLSEALAATSLLPPARMLACISRADVTVSESIVPNFLVSGR